MFSWFKEDRRPTFLDSLLSKELSIHKSELIFDNGIQIEGKINLSVRSSNPKSIVQVSKTGEINGDIKAYWAVVSGVVNGNINVEGSLEVFNMGKVNGNVICKNFIGDRNAVINGSIFEKKS